MATLRYPIFFVSPTTVSRTAFRRNFLWLRKTVPYDLCSKFWLVAFSNRSQSALEHSSKTQREIAIIGERNNFLQKMLHDAEQETKRFQDLLTNVKAEYEGRMEAIREKALSDVQNAREMAFQAEQRLTQAHTDADNARSRVVSISRELDALKAQSQDALQISSIKQSDIDALNLQIGVLKDEKALLTERAETIVVRYKADDLVSFYFEVQINFSAYTSRMRRGCLWILCSRNPSLFKRTQS